MKMPARVVAVALLALAPLLSLAQRFTEEQLGKAPWMQGDSVADFSLSPDGRHVAGIAYYGNARAAVLIEVDTGKTRLLARPARDSRYVFGQIPIDVTWVGNDLLVVDYNNRESVSIDLTGKVVARLGEQLARRMASSGPLAEWVLVYRDLDDRDLDLVHVRTGERKKYRVALPGKPDSWVFDDAGELRLVTMFEESRWSGSSTFTHWYRPSADAPWEKLQQWPVTALNDMWYPLQLLPEPDALAIISSQGRNTKAVFKYDLRTRQHGELMAGHPMEDILHVAGLGKRHADRVVTNGLRTQTVWLDPRWASLQASVDAAIPGRNNSLQGNKHGRVLISSFGDREPGRWYMLDTTTSKLREIAVAVPGIKPEDMRPMQTIRYPARDGLSIPAYLTRPAGADAQPAPMVVLIHGGPHVRDHWGWDREVQMLAGAGYVVFQPQFRGSSGFGRSFEEAGYRQWGRAMQDDITDGVKYLVEQKIADPARVCIVGASYGGYAAMWGAIQTPSLYRCGVSLAGVSDLREMLTSGLWDDSTPASRAIMRQRIGDPDQDRAALDEVSPLKHAARVGIPLLIAHGDQDLRVLPSQSKAMVRALEQAGRPVEWLPLEGEGHGLYWRKTALRYYARLMNFLDRHIGPKPGDTAAAAPAASAASR